VLFETLFLSAIYSYCSINITHNACRKLQVASCINIVASILGVDCQFLSNGQAVLLALFFAVQCTHNWHGTEKAAAVVDCQQLHSEFCSFAKKGNKTHGKNVQSPFFFILSLCLFVALCCTWP